MGTASATPDDMYAYADRTTKANDDLRQWMLGILATAIVAYQQGAVDAGNAIPGLTSGETLDAQVRALLGDLQAKDSYVRDVGAAFEKAGAASVTPPPGSGPRQPDIGHHLVTVDDQVLDDSLTKVAQDHAYEEGKKLARQGNDYQLLRILQDHQNDPDFQYFAAGFLNSLPPGKRSYLLTYMSPTIYYGSATDTGLLAKALAAAYGSGRLDHTARASIVASLGNPANGPFLPMFFRDIAGNPQAALNFANSLDKNDLKILAGATNVEGGQPELIAVFAAAVTASPDNATARALYWEITNAIAGQNEMSLGTQEGKSIGDLIAAMAVRELPPVRPGASEAELRNWGVQFGQEMRDLAMPWADATERERRNSEAATQMLVAIGSAAVSSAITLSLAAAAGPESLVATGAVKSALNIVLGTLLKKVGGKAFDGDPSAPENMKQAFLGSEEAVGAGFLIVQLLSRGLIVDANGTAVDMNNQQTVEDVANHPDHYHYKTADGPILSDELDAYRAQFSPNPIGVVTSPQRNS